MKPKYSKQRRYTSVAKLENVSVETQDEGEEMTSLYETSISNRAKQAMDTEENENFIASIRKSSNRHQSTHRQSGQRQTEAFSANAGDKVTKEVHRNSMESSRTILHGESIHKENVDDLQISNTTKEDKIKRKTALQTEGTFGAERDEFTRKDNSIARLRKGTQITEIPKTLLSVESVDQLTADMYRTLVRVKGENLTLKNVADVMTDYLHIQVANENLEDFLVIFEQREDLFTVDFDVKEALISPRTNIEVCSIFTSDTCSQHECSNLHICKYFLLSKCPIRKCKFGHYLRSSHNRKVLLNSGLDGLEQGCILTLIRNIGSRNSSTLPLLCKFYNNEGNCSKGNQCRHLHMCKHYINEDCKFGKKCLRCHNLVAKQPMSVLKRYGLTPDSYNFTKIKRLIKGTLQHGGVLLKREIQSINSSQNSQLTSEEDSELNSTSVSSQSDDDDELNSTSVSSQSDDDEYVEIDDSEINSGKDSSKNDCSEIQHPGRGCSKRDGSEIEHPERGRSERDGSEIEHPERGRSERDGSEIEHLERGCSERDGSEIEHPERGRSERDRSEGEHLQRDHPGRGRAEREHSGRDHPGRGRAEREHSGRDHPGRGRAKREHSERDHPGRGRAEREHSERDHPGRGRVKREHSERDHPGRGRAEREHSGRDRSGRGLKGRGQSEQEHLEIEHYGRDRPEREYSEKDRLEKRHPGRQRLDKDHSEKKLFGKGHSEREHSERDLLERKHSESDHLGRGRSERGHPGRHRLKRGRSERDHLEADHLKADCLERGHPGKGHSERDHLGKDLSDRDHYPGQLDNNSTSCEDSKYREPELLVMPGEVTCTRTDISLADNHMVSVKATRKLDKVKIEAAKNITENRSDFKYNANRRRYDGNDKQMGTNKISDRAAIDAQAEERTISIMSFQLQDKVFRIRNMNGRWQLADFSDTWADMRKNEADEFLKLKDDFIRLAEKIVSKAHGKTVGNVKA